MDGRTDNVKTVYPLQTKFAGGIINNLEIFTSYLLSYGQSLNASFVALYFFFLGGGGGGGGGGLDQYC